MYENTVCVKIVDEYCEDGPALIELNGKMQSKFVPQIGMEFLAEDYINCPSLVVAGIAVFQESHWSGTTTKCDFFVRFNNIACSRLKPWASHSLMSSDVDRDCELQEMCDKILNSFPNIWWRQSDPEWITVKKGEDAKIE